MESHNRTRLYREDLFDIWTQESAYILGYLEADGYINYKNKGSVGAVITFCTSDKDLLFLEKIKNIVQFSGKISFSINKCQSGIFQKVRFSITSRTWKDFLKKNLRISKIPEIPEEFLHHYIRGYFDGDGSIYLQKNSSYVSFVFSSEELANSFLDKISKIIGSSKGMKVNKKNKAKCWYFRIAKQSLVTSFSNWLYKDAVIFLERKEEKFRHMTKKVG